MKTKNNNEKSYFSLDQWKAENLPKMVESEKVSQTLGVNSQRKQSQINILRRENRLLEITL